MALRRMLFEHMTPDDELNLAIDSDRARELLESTMVEHYPFGEVAEGDELLNELQRSLYFLLLHLPGSVELEEGEELLPLQRSA